MGILRQFIPIPPPRATASYDFVDISDGTGYVTFYCYKSAISGSVSYGLTRDTNTYSVERETSGSATLDIDYDLSEFNLTKSIKGTALFNGSLFIDGDTAGGTQTCCFQVFIRKWDGTTETDLVSATSPSVSVSGQNEIGAIVNLPLEIPFTTFKRGEQLRMTVKNVLQAGTAILYQGHDPKNRDGAKVTAANNLFTAMNVAIPFRTVDI